MPYEYLTFDEVQVEKGPVSGSYFSKEIQDLYKQSFVDENSQFGLSQHDTVELSIYNSRQEFFKFLRIVPDYTFLITNGTFLDENQNVQQFQSVFPSTNYIKYSNEILLDTKNHISSSNLGSGIYYMSYNFIRNVAGNPTNKLTIKEVSPSRKEVKFSLNFDVNLNDQNKLDYNLIRSFAEKKFLFIQLYDSIFRTLDETEVGKNFDILSEDVKIKCSHLLGLKKISELQEFITKTYTGYNKILKYYNDESKESLIEEFKKFVGVNEQIKNFCRKYNQTSFSKDEIYKSFETITRQISQNAILQKTTLKNEDLNFILNAFVDVIFKNDLMSRLDAVLGDYSEKFYGLFKNVINFDNGIFSKIINHTSYVNPTTNTINVHAKLEDPLPFEYDVKSTCWISNISISPYYFKVNLFSSPVSKKVYLDGVNFNVDVDTSYSINEEKSSYVKNSIEKSKANLKSKYNDLSINYLDFENFIIYSSAELRTKVAKNKWLEYTALENKKNTILNSIGNTTTHISSSLSVEFNSHVDKQIQLLDTFDEYESYLFFNTSSINDKIIDAVEYDKHNLDSLINQLPEYIKNDEKSSEYLVFTSMIGHFFDNILLHIKKFPKNYTINNDDKLDFPKNYIEEFLNSLNWKTKNVISDNSNLLNFRLNDGDINNNIDLSYFDYAKSIFNRFLNNLPYIYKTKGTRQSIELLNNIFGIPSGMLNIREYGTNNLITNTSQKYEYENIDYLTKFENDEYIKFNFTSSNFELKKLNEFTSSIDGGYNIVTSSYSEQGIGVNALELSFKWGDVDDVPNYKSKVNLIKKIRNDQSDWQIYILKDKKRELGSIVFEFSPPETEVISTIISDPMPIFNGNMYTVAVTRDLLQEYTFDRLENSSSYHEEGSSKITKIFTTDDSRYLPYRYSLYVNQTDGAQLNFFDSKSITCLYETNKHFSSGSYFVGNYGPDHIFKGNIDKLKVYRTKLEKSDFDEHSYNINSYSKHDKKNLHSDLLFLWKFDSPVDLWSNTSSINYKVIKNQNEYYNNNFTAFNFKGKEVTLPYPECTPGIESKFPYQFDAVTLKQSLYDSHTFGPNYKNNPKINKHEEYAISNLVPYDHSTKSDDVMGSDSNLIGYFISPYSYLESKIEEFLGMDGISKIIGDPQNIDKQEYVGLQELQSQFSKLNKKYIYPQEYYSTYKFYIDFTVFDYIDDLVPSRSVVKKGLLLEPSVLERKKINIKDISIVDIRNREFDISFDNSVKFSFDEESTLYDRNNTIIKINDGNSTTVYPLNYRSEIIYDSIDDRDFIYSKYGKDIRFVNDRFIERDIYKIPYQEYRKFENNTGELITFESEFNLINSIGSGSITGSETYASKYGIYSGIMGSGYSDRHLSKVRLPTSKRTYKAISSAVSELFGMNVGVVNEKPSIYYNDSNDGRIFISPLYGTNRNFVIYNSTSDDTYMNVDRSEYITITDLSGSTANDAIYSFTVGDFGVIGSTVVPIFKFDVAVGASEISGGITTHLGSAIRVYDVETGVAGAWIQYQNQISNTEEINNVPFLKVYYTGYESAENECVIVDGKSNEIIYGSNNLHIQSKIKYYDYVKGESNRYNTVDRIGNYKGSPPIISIDGFLKLRMDTGDFGVSNQIVNEEGTNTFKFLPSTFTASLETSSSLESYIYNL
jgi:hypothetical protein